MYKKDVDVIDYAKTILTVHDQMQFKRFSRLNNKANILEILGKEYPEMDQETKKKVIKDVQKSILKPEYLNLYIKRLASRQPTAVEDSPVLHSEIESWFGLFNSGSIFPVFYSDDMNESMKPLVKESKYEAFQAELLESIFNDNQIEMEYFRTPIKSGERNFFKEGAKFTIRDEITNAVERYWLTGPISSAADIPMYFVVLVGGPQRAFHLSIIIFCHDGTKTQMYSIGLGYLLHDDFQQAKNSISDRVGMHEIYHTGVASLYSPDFLIEFGKFENSAGKVKQRLNSIIDIGILTKQHVDALNKYIQTTTSVLSDVQVRYGKMKVTHHYLNINRTYHTIANQYSFWDNCTSFVTHIFKNINCQGVANPLTPVIPSWCKSNPITNRARVKKAFALYKENSLDSVQKLIRLLTGTAGGTRKKR